MSTLKRILAYALWSLVSVLAAFIYLRIIVGHIPAPSSDLEEALFYIFGFFALQLILIVGGIIAILFILTDVLYLHKKIENSSNKTLIRFGYLLLITTVVACIHYLLEKVIDII